MLELDDTIAAIASADGGAARGILRLSGSGVLGCLKGFEAANGCQLAGLRRATAVPGSFPLAGASSRLPCTLYVWPTERSYTRQPLVEIHTLGSPPLVEWLLSQLCSQGARLARPGEFTLRAFLAGRLDLTQAEAVLGLIDADSDWQFRAALAQMAGGLAGPLTALRNSLLDLLAHLEAGLDFVEEDIAFIGQQELTEQLAAAQRMVDAIAAQMTARNESAATAAVTLYGWPNVGKSRLFNALVREERALVSPQAGTTRDYLTAEIHLGDQVARLVDTAGREAVTADSVMAAAQHHRQTQWRNAELRLLCLDSSRPLGDDELLELAADDEDRLVVLTKTDQPCRIGRWPPDAVHTSAQTGAGLPELRRAIQARLDRRRREPACVATTAARCGSSLQQAGQSLAHSHDLVETGAGHELVAAEIRVALDELGQVVGAVYTDDLLDRIFSRFCIGK